MEEILRLENVNKKYPSFSLKDVSFAIKPGEIMGFIGRNGAGKTTIFNLLTGVYKPTTGTIMLNGVNKINGKNTIEKDGSGKVIGEL